MSDLNTIKISEFENAGLLGEIDLKESTVPIVINDKNYKLKLGDRFYTEREIDNKLNELSVRIDKKLYGLNIEDSLIHTRLNELNTHIIALRDGALVDASIQVSPPSDPKGYADIYSVSNILYTPLAYDKVLISSNNGKISVSGISVNELNALKGWNFKDSKGNQLTISDKIKDLENTIKKLATDLAGVRYYSGPTYTVSKNINMNNKEYIAEKDGILSIIPYYSFTEGRFNIYINDIFITQVYQCYGDGHSHSGCCIPVKKNDKINIKKSAGGVGSMKAYLIY